MPQEFVVTAPRTITFREYTEQPLAADEVRVKTLVSGIKHGTELNLYTGDTPFLHGRFDPELRLFVEEADHAFYPVNLGSWGVGEVIETGSAQTAFEVGDHVHGDMLHRPTQARKAANLFPLHMPIDHAPFTDPGIFALAAVHDAQIKVGDKVAVIGLGAIGLLAVQIALLNGAAEVYVVDLLDDRINLALQFGATAGFNPKNGDAALAIKQATGKKGVDVAIEYSGAYAGLQTAVRCVHVAGLIVAASYFHGSREALDLGAEWHHNRPTLRSSMIVWGMPHRCAPMWDLRRIQETVIALLDAGKLTVEPMISKRFDYADAVAAYQFIEAHPAQTVKTFFDYPG